MAEGPNIAGPGTLRHADLLVRRIGVGVLDVERTRRLGFNCFLGGIDRVERFLPQGDQHVAVGGLVPKGETLARYHRRLGAYHGMGDGFMSAQIVADLKYAEPLRSAADWFTFAVSGPGSRRGLNRVLGRPVDAPWTAEAHWRKEFDRLREAIEPDLERLGLGDLHAQDLQNCLCEWAKYERTHLGEGTPKRKFRSGKPGLLFLRSS